MSFRVGDIVSVRADLTAEEKGMWPNFVEKMEPCTGHLYTVAKKLNRSVSLSKCAEDPNAPDPGRWIFSPDWLLAAHMLDADIADEIVDFAFTMELV